MSEKFDLSNGLSRRTMVKGAAWSVPVLATAIAVPMAAASEPYDVSVTSNCVGNYDLDGLLGLIAAVPLVGAGAAATVQGLLAAVGLTPVQSRGFTITANEGTIPAGTQFTLTSDQGIIDLTALGLGNLLGASVLGLVTTDGSAAILQLNSALTLGQSTSITLPVSAIDLGVTGQASLALIGSDNPGGAGAPNSANLSLVSVDTNLGSLVNLGALNVLLGALKITVQLCPGQTRPGA